MKDDHESSPTPGSGRVVLVVVGMHRSGTSALAGCLNALGVSFGEPLLPANFANERGYFEHAEVVAAHDRLLEELGTSAIDVVPLPDGWLESPAARNAREVLRDIILRNLALDPVWCVKDPRTCLVLPLWKALLAELGLEGRYLFVIRGPWEVVGSLHSRDALPAIPALEIWHRYTTAAEQETRGAIRVVLTFDRLLAQPLAELAVIPESLGVRWPIPLSEAAPRVLDFLEPSLRHFVHAPAPADLSPTIRQPIDALWAGLLGLARADEAEGQARVDELAAVCAKELSSLEPIRLARSTSASEYGVRWLDLVCPGMLRCGESTFARASFAVVGARALSRRALYVAYHWVDSGNASNPGLWEGKRTPVTEDLAPGMTWSGSFAVEAPSVPGQYELQVDLVRERVAWFSGHGVTPLVREVIIT